jgi:hypothetical protein
VNTFLKERLPCYDVKEKRREREVGEIGFNTLKQNGEEKSDERNTGEI